MQRANAAAQVEVESLADPLLSADDERHLAGVLRLRPGERVALTDGRGSWIMARWTAKSEVEVDGEMVREPEPQLSTVAFALTKNNKPELVVQKLTEVGVTRIVPFLAERSVVRWDADKQAKNIVRFARIAHDAAMQSRRVHVPVVEAVTTVSVVAGEGATAAQFGGSSKRSRFIAVGPEGGWSDAELSLFADTVDLGATVLRAETAAIVAGVRVVQAVSR